MTMLSVFHTGFKKGVVQLDREESHHLIAVRRGRKGESVRLLDGKGAIGEGVIAVADPKRAVIECLSVICCERPDPQLSLIQALPKGKTMDLVVQKAAELGVTTVIPIHTRNSESRLDESRSERKVEKWRQVAVESLKQCGNPFLPEISQPLSIEALKTVALGELRLVASLEQDARSLGATVREHSCAASVSVAIGPEGDFDSVEYQFLRENGFLPISLGPNVLRLETAAIASIAVINELFNFHRVTD